MFQTRYWLIALVSLWVASPAPASFTVGYNFAPLTGVNTSVAPTVFTGPFAGTLSNLVTGPGLTGQSAGQAINASGWPIGPIVITQGYFEFTLTPNISSPITLTTMQFSERRSGTGPRDIAVRSSLDSFTSDIFTVNVPDDALTRRHTVTFSPSFSNLTSPVTFRFYGFNAEASGGTWRLGISTGAGENPGGFPANLQLNGSEASPPTVPTPAPASLVGLLLAAPFAALVRRRRAVR